MRALRSRAFTLLEVMVATAILGLTLTVILSAQGGLAASNKSANKVGTAISLGRCKMTELEEKLLKFGYPIVDEQLTDVVCCNDEDVPGYRCDTRAETVLLPNPPTAQVGGDGGFGLSAAASAGPLGSAGAPDLPPGLGQALGVTSGGLDLNDGGSLASLNFDGGIAALGTNLQSQLGLGTGTGAQGLLSMVMGFVYPTLKPMMEASIRRLTVTVHWKEGPNDREFTLVQYTTNPQNFQSGVMSDGGVPAPGASSGAPSTSPATPGLPGGSNPPGMNPFGGQKIGF